MNARLKKLLILILVLMTGNHLYATVVVTAASGGSCLNISPGPYTAIGDIIILEQDRADIPDQTATTFILSAPTGFEFLSGSATVSYLTGRNITSVSISNNTTTVTLTISVTSTSKFDQITISNLQVRSLAAGNAGNIYRTGGSATVTGNAVVDSINHGSLTTDGTGTTVTTVKAGVWSDNTVWSTNRVPVCNENIQIDHAVIVDLTVTAKNLTISTTGNLTASNAVTVISNFTIIGSGTYTHNNSSDVSATIFAGSESFAPTSNIIVNQWYNYNVPLAMYVNSDFGNITFNAGGTWQQDGMFAPSKIKGDIIISSGQLVMDNGTGNTSTLILNNVFISGSGNLIVNSGVNRNLNLTTGSFTDQGNNFSTTCLSYKCGDSITWTVNGNLVLNDNFNIVDKAGSAVVDLSINGNFSVTGGTVILIKSTNALFNLNSSGTFAVSSNSQILNFISAGTGTVYFHCNNLNISNGNNTVLLDVSYSGINEFNIDNDAIISGNTTSLQFINITGSSISLILTIGRDLNIINSILNFANSSCDISVNVGRHLNCSGQDANVICQSKSTNQSLTSLNVQGSFIVSDNARFYLSFGKGNVQLTVTENLVINNAYFYGIQHIIGPAAPYANFEFDSFIFQGGKVNLYDVKTSANTSVNILCHSHFSAIWASNSDQIELISYDGNNDASLNMDIEGDFNISGNYNSAYFLSSQAGGDEIIHIGGNFNVSGGQVMFVCDINSTSGVDAHDIATTISGNVNISGGTTYLSARDGNASIQVDGDVTVAAGTINLKWLDGQAIMRVDGNYSQTGGTFVMHAHPSSTSDTCKVIVNQNFTQSNGTFMFDNYSGNSTAEHKLYLNGANVSLSGTGSWSHANNMSTSAIVGQVFYNSGVTTVYNYTTGFSVQHVKQTIVAGTTVNASSSTNGFMMTSHSSATAATHTALYIYGTLDMGVGIINARSQANYYSSLDLYNGGRIRLSHANGFYSGSATASTLNGMIAGNNRTNYYLYPSSIIEYYGTATKLITGIPNGIATTNNHKYGILEINHTGTADGTWAYPETDEEVYIRNELRLTAGELNLDNDHVTSGGGRTINIETGGTITRTSGYIRSETVDGSGDLRWYLTSNGSYVIPFGYNSTSYIPFTYAQTSGSTGALLAATYHTAADNTPYPPIVTHVRDENGINNSAFTVDRFWKIETTGTASASLTWTFTAAEGAGIISPRGQLWEPLTLGWYPPTAAQFDIPTNTTLANNISTFNSWWTLAAASSPLPVELISFEVHKQAENVIAEWITASEVNNAYFILEHSRDGYNFESLEKVDGNGTKSTPSYYKVIDHNPYTGINYYRLRQTDYDGTSIYSEIKTVQFKPVGSVLLFPNPASAGATFNIIGSEASDISVTIYNSSGQLIKTQQSVDENQVGNLEIQVPEKQGIYLIAIKEGDQTSFKKLIVK